MQIRFFVIAEHVDLLGGLQKLAHDVLVLDKVGIVGRIGGRWNRVYYLGKICHAAGVIEDVAADSHAAESGLQAGDLIVKVGNEAVTSPAEASSQIRAAQKAKKDAVPLLVMRDGSTYYVALQLG